MKKLGANIKENYKLLIGVFVVGLFLGWFFFHHSSDARSPISGQEAHEDHNHESMAPTIWTCSMHPQIKQDKFGLCPICAMDLIPLTTMDSGEDGMHPNEIVMSENAMKLAAVQTLVVKKGVPEKTVYLQGKVQADERNMAELTARFGGRIEKLFINFTGQYVRKGEKLATIYSPGLVTAQRELLEAVSFKESRPSLYLAAKGKLKLWDLTDKQIADIEEKGEPQVYFEVLSPISGTVSKRHVTIGDYVKEGSALFEIIDLSQVWIMFDAYESDLPWIELGDEVNITIQALPGKLFTAKVSYIDPFLNAATRIVKVRVVLTNKSQDLKPEMFAVGMLESKIAEGMNQILIPKTAFLWTGKRAVVYVKVPERKMPTFTYREVVLGPEAGAFYVVEEGLEVGEEIATNGVFKIDAASQLQGLPSMMNPDAGSPLTEDAKDAAAMPGMQEELFTVYGNCSMCKERIEKAALSVDGVQQAVWDENTKLLQLHIQPGTKPDMIHKAVALVGHDTDLETASDAVYASLHACCKYTRPNDLEQHEFKVYGNCEMCKERIETAVLSMEGVARASWDAATGMLAVAFDAGVLTLDDIHGQVAQVGHDTDRKRAPDAVYNELHACCQYTRRK